MSFPQDLTLGSGVPNAKMSKPREASVLNVALVQGGGTSDYFGWWMRSDNIATSDPQRWNFWGSKYFQVAICG